MTVCVYIIIFLKFVWSFIVYLMQAFTEEWTSSCDKSSLAEWRHRCISETMAVQQFSASNSSLDVRDTEANSIIEQDQVSTWLIRGTLLYFSTLIVMWGVPSDIIIKIYSHKGRGGFRWGSTGVVWAPFFRMNPHF